MPFGVIVVIGLIIYFFRGRQQKHNGGNSSSGMRFFCLLFWALGFIIFMIVFSGGNYQYSWAVPFAVLFLLPSLISLGSVRLGWVKCSYYLGRISFFYFMVNPVGGGLLRGFQAALRVRDEEKRMRGLRWLKKVYLGRRMPLFSGDMVMFIIIDAHLSRPGDDAYLQRRLGLLEGIPSRSVPAGVAALGLRFALASVLDSAGWDDVVKVAERWQRIGKNRLSRYLLAFNRVHYLKSGLVGRLSLWYASLFLRRASAVRQWALMQLEQSNAASDGVGAADSGGLMRLWQKSGDENALQVGLDALVSDERVEYWRRRADELGVWQFDAVWLDLETAVQSYASVNCEGDAADVSHDEYLAIEDILSAISYMEQGILKKTQPSFSGAGVEHSVDWFNLWEKFDALKHNRQAQLSAFSGCHSTIWNWMADLWNERDEHRLAYLMAVKCLPLVEECGFDEFEKTLYFMLGRKYKV